MRLIIVGASALGTQLTRIQIRQGNEVVLIERDEEIARDLAEELDCTVINAEGTRPDILEKAGIEAADAVVACTNHDQDNILIGLIAREAGIEKTIIKTDDEKFMQVAKKLGFTYLINPPQVSSTIITDVLRGVDTIQLSNLVRTDVRFISFLAGELHKGRRISELPLPDKTECIGLYRKNDFFLAREDPKLEEGDELIIITRSEHIKRIYEKLQKM